MSTASDPGARGKTIRVKYLTRVEGEASLIIRMKENRVASVHLKIFEPPRLFESLLRGRSFTEVPDIVSRICGICPVAYQMTAVHAIERTLGVEIHPQIRALRRLLYCGEWLSSHSLHIYMLQLPDLLGYTDAIAMAKEHRHLVEDALRVKKLGNRIMALLGGREIHPVSAMIGGFSKVPDRSELLTLVEDLKWAGEAAIEKTGFLASLPLSDFKRDYEFVALSHPSDYAMNEGRLVSNRGLNIDVAEYENAFEEHQVKHSTALHSTIRGRGTYLVGPLARFNLNYCQLPKTARQVAEWCEMRTPCLNPFKSMLARAIEIIFAIEESLRIIAEYEQPPSAHANITVREGSGCAITEAPRGINYARYNIDAMGNITSARIVPPTSQNQKQIEEDLATLAPTIASLPVADITRRCEEAVRNYDPCISCATHFLRVAVEHK